MVAGRHPDQRRPFGRQNLAEGAKSRCGGADARILKGGGWEAVFQGNQGPFRGRRDYSRVRGSIGGEGWGGFLTPGSPYVSVSA